MSLTVAPVEGRRGARIFAEAGRTARRGDKLWSEPLSLEAALIFNGAKSPFMRRNPHAYLVAFDEGRPVGRVFVADDRDHQAIHPDGAAHFGFLDAADDPAIIPALMEAAAGWARQHGRTALEGPYSPAINHEIGLLTESDGRPATFKTNDAPPRYAAALRALGFRTVQELCAYEAEIAASDYPERTEAVLARWGGRNRLSIRPFNLLAFGKSVREENEVYADAWADNWHAVPPPEDEARFIARFMLLSVPPRWLTMAAWDGVPIGVLHLIPDLNEAARGVAGHEWTGGLLRYSWRLHAGGVKRARIATFGVRRAFRGTRIGAMATATLVADAVRKARRAGISRLEVSWMLTGNRAAIATVERLPARRTKTWAMFRKEFRE
ncbi:MAG TPA: GNAT family N-acetyltransferase [Hyphomicrobiales bacterium]|nr:GNAT family N-acetyltransferase [Hyphomicrobiales bacterium]